MWSYIYPLHNKFDETFWIVDIILRGGGGKTKGFMVNGQLRQF